MTVKMMTDDEFLANFRPALRDDGTLREIHPASDDYEAALRENRLWTLLDNDGNMIITPGLHWVNRMQYVMTEVPHTAETPDVLWHNDSDESWFINHYHCPSCGHKWQDEWSCQVDDDCPSCGARHISPHTSEESESRQIED
ncbi:hypothetical protein [Chitinibacter tainanensis]|uniref:hypothetical protein n=1 Tax=Chitinibacter tainanensis TaxID=230667 RepID=UPI0003F938AA|nr:hypothetical protein [Chitinibacter tainanensis]